MKSSSSGKSKSHPICGECLSFWDLEAVSGAANGFQIARVLGVGLDLFADAADIDVDRARGDVRGITPDGIEKMVAAEDASFMASEIIEQAELGSSCGHHGTANSEGHGGRINLDFSNRHRAGWQGALEAAEDGFDPGHELSRTERLGDVVVGTELETENAVGFTAFGRKKNYGNCRQTRSLADVAADLETILAGDHDVENEKSRALALGIGENVRSGGIDANDETLIFKVMADESGNIGIVFNDEDAWFHGIILYNAVRST